MEMKSEAVKEKIVSLLRDIKRLIEEEGGDSSHSSER